MQGWKSREKEKYEKRRFKKCVSRGISTNNLKQEFPGTWTVYTRGRRVSSHFGRYQTSQALLYTVVRPTQKSVEK